MSTDVKSFEVFCKTNSNLVIENTRRQKINLEKLFSSYILAITSRLPEKRFDFNFCAFDGMSEPIDRDYATEFSRKLEFHFEEQFSLLDMVSRMNDRSKTLQLFGCFHCYPDEIRHRLTPMDDVDMQKNLYVNKYFQIVDEKKKRQKEYFRKNQGFEILVEYDGTEFQPINYRGAPLVIDEIKLFNEKTFKPDVKLPSKIAVEGSVGFISHFTSVSPRNEFFPVRFECEKVRFDRKSNYLRNLFLFMESRFDEFFGAGKAKKIHLTFSCLDLNICAYFVSFLSEAMRGRNEELVLETAFSQLYWQPENQFMDMLNLSEKYRCIFLDCREQKGVEYFIVDRVEG